MIENLTEMRANQTACASDTPQIEDGYTKLANQLLDEIIKADFSARQYKILLAIIRKTYGFNKKSDQISLGQFEKLTGIKANKVSPVLNELKNMEVLSISRGEHAREIALNKNSKQWVFPNRECPEREFPKEDKRGSHFGSLGVPILGTTKDISKDNQKTIQCPVDELVELYHQSMPNNPRCKVINNQRRSAINARWVEASRIESKPFGYDSKEKGIDAWRIFFETCSESEFLTGRVSGNNGRRTFIADIDFLMSPKGFVGCLENKYHRGTA